MAGSWRRLRCSSCRCGTTTHSDDDDDYGYDGDGDSDDHKDNHEGSRGDDGRLQVYTMTSH